MVTEKEINKSVRLTKEDAKVVRELERRLEAKHGRLTFTQIVRMAIRSLAENSQQVA